MVIILFCRGNYVFLETDLFFAPWSFVRDSHLAWPDFEKALKQDSDGELTLPSILTSIGPNLERPRSRIVMMGSMERSLSFPAELFALLRVFSGLYGWYGITAVFPTARAAVCTSFGP